MASGINSKSWTGTAVWREECEPFPIRKPAGPALLHLNDEGGLLRAGPTFPETLRVDLRFGWEEVQKIERMRYLLGIPFLGEAVRFTLKAGPTGTGSRTFSFGGIMRKRTTEEIVDFGESEGRARSQVQDCSAVNLTSILLGPYFRRIHLPRTRVHRGKKKRRGEKLRPGE